MDLDKVVSDLKYSGANKGGCQDATSGINFRPSPSLSPSLSSSPSSSAAMMVQVCFKFLGHENYAAVPDLTLLISRLEDHRSVSMLLDEHIRRSGAPNRGSGLDYQFQGGERVGAIGMILRQAPREVVRLVVGYRLIPAPRVRSLDYTRWISSVNSSTRLGLGAIGSYDGLVRLWENNLAQDRVRLLNYQLIGHDGPVRDVKWVGGRQLVSGSTDKSVLVWTVPDQLSSSPLSGMSISVKPIAKLVDHTAPISCIAVSPNGGVLAAADNGEILQWTLPTSDDETTTAITEASDRDESDVESHSHINRYRARTAKQLTSVSSSGRLVGHHPSVVISGLAATYTMAYTSSYDHSLRIWDLESSHNLVTWYSAHSITALEKLNPTLVAVAGGAGARYLTLYDTRQPMPAMVMEDPAHQAAISQIAQREESNGLALCEMASASHDCTVQIWDWRCMNRSRAGLVISETATKMDSNERSPAVASTSNAAVFDIDWTSDGLAIVGQSGRVDLVDV